MKLKNVFLKGMSLACIGAAALVSSCNEEDRLTLQDTQDITEEAITDSYFQDMDDMAGVSVQAPSETQFNSGRVATTTITITDDRFQCAGVVVTIDAGPNSTVDVPSGVITVDFGTTGCSDLKGNIRTGKLIFTYYKRRFQPGSTVVTTTENYTINGVKLEGTRTLTNVTGSTENSPKFNVTLANGKATFQDGTIATRVSDITWQWVRGTSVADDYLLIDQSSTANGITRGERSYKVSLSKALKFKRFCGGIPTEGIKKYVIDNDKDIVIDYGDGTCDKTLVVTVNGVTRSLTVN
jgi:hypothetical protein